VAAPARFANPFECEGSLDAHLGALVKFGVWLAGQRDLLAEVRRLAGRNLSCTREPTMANGQEYHLRVGASRFR
jgi:hypothetical protein